MRSSGHRIFFSVSNCWMNSYSKFGSATRRLFFAICEKPEGADNRPPPAVRGVISFRRPYGSKIMIVLDEIHSYFELPASIFHTLSVFLSGGVLWTSFLTTAHGMGTGMAR